ncbi:hypothetical protein SAMN07250955_102295 [Arboricoccus pini]|uniref:DUF3472 domain-containing protein n=1 Tax=Arboricoccus pini TaxID=1963835 RepID=A0A212QQ64_9PROT|nr:hypothetical protein [Arboricoccus pini]SNB61598.1 hypothetical protein SAMN07250955_102295 [Arboricoccus pini]
MSMRRWLLAGFFLCSLPLSGCTYINNLFHPDDRPDAGGLATNATPSEFAQAIFQSDAPTAFDALEWDLNVTKFTPGANTRWYWALWAQFEHGPGFYVGLQPDGQFLNSPPGKKAVFSFFGADTQGLTPNCTAYGRDKRASCRLPFDWKTGETYRFAVKRAPGPSSDTIAWTATITARSSGVTTPIGTVSVPASYGNIQTTTQGWSEWTPGVPANCDVRSSFAATMTSPTGYVAGKSYPETVTRGQPTGCVIVFPDGPETLIMQTRLGNEATTANTPVPTATKKTTAPAVKKAPAKKRARS